MQCKPVSVSASTRFRKLLLLAEGALVYLLIIGTLRAEESSSASIPLSLTAVVAEFKDALRIPNPIEILIVEDNDLLVSVSHDSRDNQRYRMSFERSFLQSLTDKEIRAAVAHEFGHVWIFTHHPYLQTEELADQIAGRVVSQTELDQIHLKTNAYLAERRLLVSRIPEREPSEKGLGEIRPHGWPRQTIDGTR